MIYTCDKKYEKWKIVWYSVIHTPVLNDDYILLFSKLQLLCIIKVHVQRPVLIIVEILHEEICSKL